MRGPRPSGCASRAAAAQTGGPGATARRCRRRSPRTPCRWPGPPARSRRQWPPAWRPRRPVRRHSQPSGSDTHTHAHLQHGLPATHTPVFSCSCVQHVLKHVGTRRAGWMMMIRADRKLVSSVSKDMLPGNVSSNQASPQHLVERYTARQCFQISSWAPAPGRRTCAGGAGRAARPAGASTRHRSAPPTACGPAGTAAASAASALWPPPDLRGRRAAGSSHTFVSRPAQPGHARKHEDAHARDVASRRSTLVPGQDTSYTLSPS